MISGYCQVMPMRTPARAMGDWANVWARFDRGDKPLAEPTRKEKPARR